MALLQIAEPGQSSAPHEHRIAIGIDLGTTHSLVATVLSGKAKVLNDEQGRVLLPSTVHYTSNQTHYGDDAKQTNIQQETAYLNYNGGSVWLGKEEGLKLLSSNYKNLEKLLNKFEEKLNLKSRTSIILDEDTLILKAPIYWTKTTALISVYTLIIRCYFNVSDFTDDNFEEILKTHKPFISGDSYYIKNCVLFYNNPQIKYDKINECEVKNCLTRNVKY